MIYVKPFKLEGETASYRLGFLVKGHANYAEHGQDIVCASVSAIVQTAIAGLDHYNPIQATVESGRVRVKVLHDDHTSDAIIKTMLLGLKQIERQYPDYIKIVETEETM